jgi:hypothetical protein
MLVPDQDGREFKTGGIHWYFEDLKRAANTKIYPPRVDGAKRLF